MMRRIIPTAVSLVGFLLLGNVRGALAEHAKPQLEPGMTMGDVLTRWGEPTDKVEHEVRRTMVWHYPLGKVIFLQGKLAIFPSVTAPVSDAGPVASNVEVPHRIRPEPPADFPLLKGGGSDDLFAEVLKEVPSDEEKGVSSRGGPPTGGPSIIRPMPGGLPPPQISDNPESSD